MSVDTAEVTEEEAAAEAKANRSVLSEDQWACPDSKCLFINSQDVVKCKMCGRSKPKAKGQIGHEIGKDLAEKSKGLFAAEDWQCSKCGNVNWARRNTCNICNAPKFGEVEARTGYGGGFMDRGVVEYRETRYDSDGEYDEYGRKKKKDERGVASAPHRSPPSNGKGKAPEVEDEEDEEEDDDDDDDGDLGKYALFDDDELPEITKTNMSVPAAKEPKQAAGAPSKSRGRSDSGSSSSSSSSSTESSSRSQSSSSASSDGAGSRSRSSKAADQGSGRRSNTKSHSRSRSKERRERAKRTKHRSGSGSSRSGKSKSESRSRSPRRHNNRR